MAAITQELKTRISATGADQTASELNKVGDAAEKNFGERTGIAKYAKGAGIALAAAGTAAVAAVASVGAIAAKVSAAGDEFAKMAERTGIAAEELSTLKFAAERSGTDIGTLEIGLKRLARTATEASEGSGAASDAFETLGVSSVDADGKIRPTEELLLDMADALTAVESDTQRAALAQDVFGRSGAELIPLLNEGSDGIKLLQERARDLGLEFSTTAANQSADFQDAMLDLKSSFGGIVQEIGVAVIPALTALANGITRGVALGRAFIERIGGIGQAFTDIGDLIKGFGATFTNLIDAVFTGAFDWSAFLGGISDALVAGGVLFKNFLVNTGEAIFATSKFLWEPIKFAFNLIWEPIKSTAVNALNGLVEAVLIPINAIIDGINSVGEHFGITIDNIDFTPLTVDAPKSMAESYLEMKDNLSMRFDEMGQAWKDVGTGIVEDSADVVDGVDEAWGAVEEHVDERVTNIVDKYATETSKIIDEAEIIAQETGEALMEGVRDEIVDKADSHVVAPMTATGMEAGSSFVATMKGFLDSNLANDLAGPVRTLMRGGTMRQAMGQVGGQAGRAFGQAFGGPIGAIIGEQVGTVLGEKVGGAINAAGRTMNRILGRSDRAYERLVAQNTEYERNRREYERREKQRQVEEAEREVKAEEVAAGGDTQVLAVTTGPRPEEFDTSGAFTPQPDTIVAPVETGAGGSEELYAAQHGFHGQVTEPTLFLAGEAGPEMVDITPRGAGRMGGAVHLHLNIERIETPNVQSLRAYVESALGPEITRYMRQAGFRGVEMVPNNGTFAEPTV